MRNPQWNIAKRDVFGANGISLLVRGPCTGGCMVNFRSRYKLIENHVANARTHCCGRSFASEASKKLSETSSAESCISLFYEKSTFKPWRGSVSSIFFSF